MNVLSLFDGISCGQLALQRAGIKVAQYFASEIDTSAIAVTQKQFPTTIQLGDVQKIKSCDLPKIDLLIGGSPCQGFSKAGLQLNFDDNRSKLFFEFVRLLKECKPTHFLLENVEMKKEWVDIISSYLGVNPVLIDSANFSAQQRKRLYWTNLVFDHNLPTNNDCVSDILEPEVDDKFFLKHEKVFHLFIDNHTNKRKVGFYNNSHQDTVILHINNKSYTVLCKHFPFYLIPILENSNQKNIHRKIEQCTSFMVTLKNESQNYIRYKLRKLTPLECERLQTLPDNYTLGFSDTARYKMLGNCWTVDVIAFILMPYGNFEKQLNFK